MNKQTTPQTETLYNKTEVILDDETINSTKQCMYLSFTSSII